jgi:hypothetical protein
MSDPDVFPKPHTIVPDGIIQLLPRVVPPRCEPGANRVANRKKLASMVVLLACRGGVRTFAAACGWRTSLACLLGALAAAPGSVAMLAHRRMAFRVVLAHWRFRFQAGLEFFTLAWSHHFYVGDVRSA